MYRRICDPGLLTVVLLILTGNANAQSQEERIRGAMSESLHQQQESVKLQTHFQKKSRFKKSGRSAAIRLSYFPVAFAPPSVAERACSPVSAEEIHPQIDQAALEQGIPADLLRAVARVESGFVPCAISPKGAMGIMQIMPGTARDLGLVNPWNSQESLTAGAKYLRQLLDHYSGDVRLALGAYNAGPARVDRYGDIPPIDETRSYVHRILKEFSSAGSNWNVVP